MATVKIEVVAGAQTMTHTRTVSADHLTRFITALRFMLNLNPALTDLQVLDTWAGRVLTEARGLTREYERGAASSAVQDIAFDN